MSDEPSRAVSGGTAAPRVGVLGGTFDPVHLGHLASAREMRRAFDLDRVLLVLSARPPHKHEAAHAAVEDRLAMLELAVADQAGLVASDMEVRRAGASYTVDTLAQLARAHPGGETYLIVGIDAWRDVDAWSRPEDLLTLAHVIVTARPGVDFRDTAVNPPVAARPACWYDPGIRSYVHKSGHRLIVHRFEGFEASSTDIRRRVREGLPFAHLVPRDVARYIEDRKLYA